MEIRVLDKGFVRLESSMGGDQAVLRAARVSYKSESIDETRDRKLIAYLLEHKHGTPFEHAVFTFHVKLPIFVARQWIRHRMSSYNETSFRYREAPEEFYIPDKWRGQDPKNKQGSVAQDKFPAPSFDLMPNQADSMRRYRALIEMGIAREMARMVLPVNLYTEWYWSVNARALIHFLELRCEQHAQWEIRQYSHALAKIMAFAMPWTFGAWINTLEVPPYQEMFEELQKAVCPNA